MLQPAHIPLDAVRKVTFYKRDEITTDLICCDVEVGDKVFVYHEELAVWGVLIQHLKQLPNFRADWFASVAQAPFEASEMIAFSRR